MRTIEEIVEGLNHILSGLNDEGLLLNEDLKEWNSILADFYIWREVNKI